MARIIKKISIILGVLVLAAIISYFLLETNEKQFNQESWTSNPLMRYKMSKDIIESNMLIGKTKGEVIMLLGTTETSNLQGKEHVIYALGKPPSFFDEHAAKLVVIFENNLVTKAIHSHE